MLLNFGSSIHSSTKLYLFVRDITKLHSVPTHIFSDRDLVFLSTFWCELFKLQGTILVMSSTCQPQLDDQTEVLNNYLEDYLRCFTANHPRQWTCYLQWAEWHYNTTWHSAINMSPLWSRVWSFSTISARLPFELIIGRNGGWLTH